eukprot:CAMPEP_0197186148 /NCGR_PEP_ID=MMETSP1423-20130617/13293_1 /TAXON_ID=476441 /ORGANISM="Pseudo-nitzschia heimii, Strain UNC1101" /LENGTH=819 /DNA_ID=CAMNT_0042637371 /DNA_START=190 /DNA_END=2649 /DNA_ORIENTATION=+
MSNAHLQSKLSGDMSTKRRAPLQSRDPNTICGSYRTSNSNSTEEYNSRDFNTVNRLSHLESSNNECNKRVINTTNNSKNGSLNTHRGHQQSNVVRRSASSSEIREGSESHIPTQSRPNLQTKRSSSTSNLEEDSVIIEEHRRKLNGEGYTLHRYLRGKMLGKGGFAKVYLCTALDTQKAYAIKIVPKSNLVKARALQKLKAEIKIHRTLKHKNVCEYKHFFEDKTNCYILLELCHNQSMNEMIKRRKRLTEQETAFFMRQLLEATKYIHDQLVIHRDLKLGNLFLDRNMNIKVGDLGLATKLESADEIRKTICGTPNYIAPEVIQGDRATRGHSFQVDIWSIGVIMYTCLVGKPPYEAKDVKATYQRIMANVYSFPKHINISDDAKDLIVRMLQSKPTDRPTLHQIALHPFLNSHFIPKSLPSNATHMAPDFSGLSGYNQKKAFERPALPKLNSQRRPFGARDANAQNTVPDRAEKKKPPPSSTNSSPVMDVQGAVRSAWSAVVNVASPAIQKSGKFQVFDETNARNSQKEDISDRDIVSRTANLGIESADNKPIANLKPAASEYTPVAQQSDAFILSSMLERVSIVLDVVASRDYSNVSPNSQSLIPISSGGPTNWVERYVDYTSKYGLGYLLNEGSSGVYFNDSTKVVLEAKGVAFQYIERRKTSDDPSRRSEPTITSHTLANYPNSLQKKVTLLTHFRDYLMEQQNKLEGVGSMQRKNCNDVNGGKCDMAYLKKWVRTRHAVFFRLSNQTVQIVFYDHTEIILTSDERYVTYVDRDRNRSTFYMTDELVGCNTEIERRLKYTKEILQQLVDGSVRR